MSIALNNNGVFWIRNLWIGSFTGMAGMSLHWNAGYDYALWQSHFPQIAAFLAPYNFNESSGNVKGWMPGHDYDKTHSGSGLSRYGVSDLFYLRSPDNENAVGVIANRTYNFFTQWSCETFPIDTTNDEGKNIWRKFSQTRIVTSGDTTIDDYLYINPRISLFNNEHVYVKNISGYPTKRYVIEYYNAWNPTVVIKTETKRNDNWNGLRLEFPATTGTNARPIVLFRIFPFKNKSSEFNDSLNNDSLTYNNIAYWNIENQPEFERLKPKVYPNPVSGILQIEFSSQQKFSWLRLFDCSGRVLIEKQTVERIECLNVTELIAGTYILEIRTNNDLFHFKICKQ